MFVLPFCRSTIMSSIRHVMKAKTISRLTCKVVRFSRKSSLIVRNKVHMRWRWRHVMVHHRRVQIAINNQIQVSACTFIIFFLCNFADWWLNNYLRAGEANILINVSLRKELAECRMHNNNEKNPINIMNSWVMDLSWCVCVWKRHTVGHFMQKLNDGKTELLSCGNYSACVCVTAN